MKNFFLQLIAKVRYLLSLKSLLEKSQRELEAERNRTSGLELRVRSLLTECNNLGRAGARLSTENTALRDVSTRNAAAVNNLNKLSDALQVKSEAWRQRTLKAEKEIERLRRAVTHWQGAVEARKRRTRSRKTKVKRTRKASK